MVQTPQKHKTLNQSLNQWQTADWETFVTIADSPASAKAKCYYFQSQMRVETMGVGPNHAVDNTLLILAVSLFCMTQKIPNRGLTNASYRKSGYDEAQPDISYYLGEATASVPDSNTIINLDACPPPDLAIEIAATSLSDDLGMKRLLYESLGIKEYWVVNVEQGEIIAFEILSNQGSQRITTSIVLPGLAIATLEEALRSRSTQDDSQIMAQLMTQFQIVVNN
jgi:Uma2 family endonuclease